MSQTMTFGGYGISGFMLFNLIRSIVMVEGFS